MPDLGTLALEAATSLDRAGRSRDFDATPVAGLARTLSCLGMRRRHALIEPHRAGLAKAGLFPTTLRELDEALASIARDLAALSGGAADAAAGARCIRFCLGLHGSLLAASAARLELA